MRLTAVESVEVPTDGGDVHFHNVPKGECNRNQQDNLTEFEDLNSTQWASNFLTSQNSTLTSNVNNNVVQQHNVRRPSLDGSYDLLSESSPDDSLGDVDADAPQSGSSLDVSQSLSHDELSDSESLSDDTNCTSDFAFGRGIVNPNYPGFQHLAHHLQRLDTEDLEEAVHNADDDNNNNGEGEFQTLIDSVNHLGRVESTEKAFYDKPKIDITEDLEEERYDVPDLSVLDLVNDLNVPVVNESAQNAAATDVNVRSAEEDFGNNTEAEFTLEATCDADAESSAEETDIQTQERFINVPDLENDETGNSDSQTEKAETNLEREESPRDSGQTSAEESIMLLDEDAFDCVGAVALNIRTSCHNDESSLNKIAVDREGFMNNNIKSDLAGNELKTVSEQEMKRVKSECLSMDASDQLSGMKMGDAFFLHAIHADLSGIDEANRTLQRSNADKSNPGDSNRDSDEREKFTKEEQTANEKEKDEDSVTPRKKEKMDLNYSMKKNRHSIFGDGVTSEATPVLSLAGGVVRRREFGPRGRESILSNRRSMPNYEKKRSTSEMLGGFDVYNIETAMPKIDLDAIESHLRVAREEDRRRRNDREEIRKRLAMGSDADEYYGGDRPGRKPSLQARLQSGMNLQICFMNETASDADSPGSDVEQLTSPDKVHVSETEAQRSRDLPLKSPSAVGNPGWSRPSASKLTLQLRQEPDLLQTMTEADFFARQARLQAEAHMALAQAKEMAHMQMEIERQRQKKSPITEMVRTSLEKVGIPFPEDRRRVSRQILTEMNLAQLQVIVNDLHTQIEVLNEGLVKFLMNRDDLHMEQDSMLVDIEDLTRYLGAKEQSGKPGDQPSPTQDNILLLASKSKLCHETGLVRK